MSTTVFVGNVSYDATENELQDLFSQHGTVTDVNLMVDRVTKKPRGFAFVSMESKEAADAAIRALNGAELHGRKLTVNEARPREDRPPREGGGGRGDRGDRGGGGGGGYRGGGGGRDRR
ncbi:MAG TPA: RNA-binding protein [Verrucomicrobiae bacterium]|nr:RNA-binding protein [Verrucomicrobiae bacterium]